MTKLRVYELARELNVETKVLLSKLKGGARNLSHQSTLTDQQVSELREAFSAPAAQASGDPSKRKVVIRRRVATVGEDVTASLGSSSLGGVNSLEDLSADVAPEQAVMSSSVGIQEVERKTPAPIPVETPQPKPLVEPSEREDALLLTESIKRSISPSSKEQEKAPITDDVLPQKVRVPDNDDQGMGGTNALSSETSKAAIGMTTTSSSLGDRGQISVSDAASLREQAQVTDSKKEMAPAASPQSVRRSTSQSATIVRPAQASQSATVVRSAAASTQKPIGATTQSRIDPAISSDKGVVSRGVGLTNSVGAQSPGSAPPVKASAEVPISVGQQAKSTPSAPQSPSPSNKPLAAQPIQGSTAGLTPGAGIAAPIPPNRMQPGGTPHRPTQNPPLRQNVPGSKPVGSEGYPSGGGYGRSTPPSQNRSGASSGSFRSDQQVAGRREEAGRDFRSSPSRGAMPVPSQVPLSGTPGQQVVPSGGNAPKKREMGGATIVRKATPEEVENLQNQAAKRQQTGRKEDHRGTRVTGLGLLQNRISVDAPGPISADPTQIPPPFEETELWNSRKGNQQNKDRKATADEEELAKKRAIKKAKAQSNLNMRALLEQVDELDRSEEDPASQARTVYMPAAPRSKRDLKRRKDLKKTQITTPRAAYRVIEMGESITVNELAKHMAIKSTELIKKLMAQGVMATLNQSIDVDVATLLATEFGFEIKSIIETVDDIIKTQPVDEATLETRPPIVTVMGHVDHGKTSILDAIRSANVAQGEAGGITQHIGAYSVERHGKKITFLDTPGHEAFSAMRSRGAKLTDIVVLVVAADDGVMPQTIEAISHAKAAGVPLIVAINKIDKPNINFDRIYTELSEHGVQAEEWGGDVQFVKCSALQKRGIDDLLEGILLLAEVSDLKSTRKGFAQGIVIEAHLDKGRGPVATVVVERGVLRVGDLIVAGNEYGRIRAMHDHLARDVAEANPSEPVEIIGLSGVPMAGDSFHIVTDEKTAREAADWRVQQARRLAAAKSSAASLEDLLNRVKTEDVYEVPIILKADTQGSLEAISETILKLSTQKVKNRIIHAAVGGVTESDITLASASGALVVAFNVRAMRGLDDFAERSGVPIKYFSIIYEIVDAVKAIMVGKLPPIINEVILGHAEVRKPINVPKIGTIAGSAVLDGKIARSAQCRLIRDSVVIYTGKLGSLRRFKDDVKEVAQGFECGIGIDGYNDIREGDVIEAFSLEETMATL